MRYEQWNWFINEETGEYQTTVIKFSLPYPEWLKLQESEAWKEVSEMVRLAQEKEHSRRYRLEQEHRTESAPNSKFCARKHSRQEICCIHKQTQGLRNCLLKILNRLVSILLPK